MGLIKFGRKYNDSVTEDGNDSMGIHPSFGGLEDEEFDGKIHPFRHWFEEEEDDE